MRNELFVMVIVDCSWKDFLELARSRSFPLNWRWKFVDWLTSVDARELDELTQLIPGEYREPRAPAARHFVPRHAIVSFYPLFPSVDSFLRSTALRDIVDTRRYYKLSRCVGPSVVNHALLCPVDENPSNPPLGTYPVTWDNRKSWRTEILSTTCSLNQTTIRLYLSFHFFMLNTNFEFMF